MLNLTAVREKIFGVLAESLLFLLSVDRVAALGGELAGKFGSDPRGRSMEANQLLDNYGSSQRDTEAGLALRGTHLAEWSAPPVWLTPLIQ
jgi:hypothetical protein